jgi:hypothetical protein
MLKYLDIVIAFSVIMLGLSLVITLLNQMISAFLSYRGSNLRWGIQTMLRTLNKGALGPHAQEIADRILTEPIVSDSIVRRFGDVKVPVLGWLLKRWKLAAAIGPDTLVRTLAKVSTEMRGANPDVADAINALLDAPDDGTLRRLEMVSKTFGEKLHVPGAAYAVKVNELLKELGNSAQESVGKVEAWFNVVIGRVSQRFTTQMRIWTVIFSFLVAFGIHLDSLDLINQLMTNPATVQNLVNLSGSMLKEAEGVLGNNPAAGSDPTAPTVSPQVLGDQMKELLKEVKPEETKSALGTIPSFRSMADAEKWLSDNLKDPPDVKPERKAELIGKYKGMVLTGLGKKIGDINKALKETGIQIVPDHQKITGPVALVKFVFCFKSKTNFFGILLTAGLLALGAPFWYNALKNLTNLRPAVAKRQDQQKQGAAG